MYEQPPTPDLADRDSPYPRGLGALGCSDRVRDLAAAYSGFEGITIANFMLGLVIWGIAAGAGHGDHYAVGVFVYGFPVLAIIIGIGSYGPATFYAKAMGRPRSFAHVIAIALALQSWFVLGLIGSLLTQAAVVSELKKLGIKGKTLSVDRTQLDRLISLRRRRDEGTYGG